MLVQKLIFASTVVPCIRLLELQWKGKSGSISPSKQLSQLVKWIEIAIIWGPLAPVLYPILLWAVFTHFTVHVVATSYLGACAEDEPGTNGPHDKPPSLSKTFLRLSIGVGLILHLRALVEVCKTAFYVSSLVLLLVPFYFYKQRIQRFIGSSNAAVEQVELVHSDTLVRTTHCELSSHLVQSYPETHAANTGQQPQIPAN